MNLSEEVVRLSSKGQLCVIVCFNYASFKYFVETGWGQVSINKTNQNVLNFPLVLKQGWVNVLLPPPGEKPGYLTIYSVGFSQNSTKQNSLALTLRGITNHTPILDLLTILNETQLGGEGGAHTSCLVLPLVFLPWAFLGVGEGRSPCLRGGGRL